MSVNKSKKVSCRVSRVFTFYDTRTASLRSRCASKISTPTLLHRAPSRFLFVRHSLKNVHKKPCGLFAPFFSPWLTCIIKKLPCRVSRDTTFYDTRNGIAPQLKLFPQFLQHKLRTQWGPYPNRTQFLLVRHSSKNVRKWTLRAPLRPFFLPWLTRIIKKNSMPRFSRLHILWYAFSLKKKGVRPHSKDTGLCHGVWPPY